MGPRLMSFAAYLFWWWRGVDYLENWAALLISSKAVLPNLKG